MSWDEYILRRKGLKEKRQRELRQEYQHMRMLIYYMIETAPYVTKSTKRQPLDKLVPDIYDDKPAKVINLKDRYNLLLERLEKAGMLEQPKKPAKSGSE